MSLHGLDIPGERLAVFCQTNGIRRLALFGSILRDDFRPDSDVDMLVEFRPGVQVGYFAMARMANELTAMLGRAVDLRTPGELHAAFREEVLREALTAYVAA
ncbi:MAG: nucleotidyltransferase family protein [Planctomycetota bacterium]